MAKNFKMSFKIANFGKLGKIFPEVLWVPGRFASLLEAVRRPYPTLWLRLSLITVCASIFREMRPFGPDLRIVRVIFLKIPQKKRPGPLPQAESMLK